MLTPELVATGVAYAERNVVASLLALFTDSDLPTLLRAQITDLSRRFNSEQGDTAAAQGAFAERLADASIATRDSSSSDEQLRVQLWMHLRDAMGLKPALTFSQDGIKDLTDDIGQRVPEIFAAQLYDEEVRDVSLLSSEYWEKHAARRLNPFAKPERPEFGFEEVVQQVAIRTLAGAADRGELPEDVQDELLDRVRSAVEELPPDARKRLFDEIGVDQLSDSAALKILLGGGGLVGLGVAVELSGFAAYILAAKASAIIPLVGGKTLVSTLAVLSNPVFIMPVLVLGGGALSRSIQNSLRAAVCPAVASILALRALASEQKDARPLVEIFSALPKHVSELALFEWRDAKRRRAGRRLDWVTEGLGLVGRAAKWSVTRVLVDPFPDAVGYLDQFERLGGEV